jgi:hypothetical protein
MNTGLGHLLSTSSYFESYSENEAIYVKGFASVDTEDRVGDIVDPLEFNVDTFVNTGTLLRDHKYISDAFGNHLAAGRVIAAEPAEIYQTDGKEFSIKSIRTGDHITTLLEEKHPELSVGSRGLFVVAEVINDLAKSEVEKGILNAFSWKGWSYGEKEGNKTRLKSVDLSEISLVHQPINNQSTYVKIKDTDAKMLADKLRITKLKFRSNAFSTMKSVQDYLDARHITAFEIKESSDGFVAVLEDVSKYEVAKSVCIASGDCELIAAPLKDQDYDTFVATVAGEEPETSKGENEMSQDTQTPERQSFNFCVVDEAILQKLFPKAGRSELAKGATLALEDGEVANVEIYQADISDEEIEALLTPKAETPAEAEVPAETPEAEAVEPAATETPAAQATETPNVHEDLIALIKATAERQAQADKALAELLSKDKDKQVSELDQLKAELKAAKAELAKLIPAQDEREERTETQKGAQVDAPVGQMFSFLFN